ncbi:MAG: hypothetical protein E7525_02755 [Ruminococcaceae bacterium]|nr:hypothetical protein [Oscillospiraceae bacterium]
MGLKIAIWTVCSLMFLGLVGFSILNPTLAFLLLLLAAAVMFIAYYLTCQLNIEYEYALTNDEIDIDRITNKSKRQRMANFKIRDIEDIAPYDPSIHVTNKANNKNVYIGCDPTVGEPLAFKIHHPRNGYYTLVLTPNEEFRAGMKKYLPYLLRDKV